MLVIRKFAVSRIRQNRAPICDGHGGRRSLALIESIYRAAKTPDCVVTVRSS